MSDSEKAARDVVDWIVQNSYVDDMGYVHTDGLEQEALLTRIREIIDKHMC